MRTKKDTQWSLTRLAMHPGANPTSWGALVAVLTDLVDRLPDGETVPAPDTRREDHLDAACAWSDFRKDYGVSGDDKVRRQEHRAFMAGWQSARGTIDAGGVQR